jgi:hypothetical protein
MTASIEEMADAVSHLSLSELNRLSTAVLERMPNGGKAAQQFQESLLLFAIHETLTDSQQERYAQLITRRREETLSETEYVELLELSTLIETMDARRLELLAQLATLRQVPLTQLISNLNLPQHTV